MAKELDKNKDKKTKANKASIKVETIPKSFYGGKNPVILEKQENKISKPIKKQKITKKIEPKKVIKPVSHVPTSIPKAKIDLPANALQPKQTIKPNQAQTQKINQPKKSSNKMFIIGIIIFFILGLAAIAYYFLYLDPNIANNSKNTSNLDTQENTQVIQDDLSESEVINEDDEIATSTQDDINLSTSTQDDDIILNNTDFELVFPSTLVSFTDDLDQDGLYDKEETIFQTDPGIGDSDQDGYSDLLEIENLYNPTGFAPVKIIDSGLVQEYLNPTWKYRLYFPSTWQAGEVDELADQVIFSTVDNQYIEVITSKKLVNESFVAWFGRIANSQKITELSRTKNRFDQEIYTRKDGLVTYIDSKDAVYIIVYKNELDEPIEYKNIVTLLSQSFRVNKSVTLDNLPKVTTQTTTTQNIISTTTTSTIN